MVRLPTLQFVTATARRPAALVWLCASLLSAAVLGFTVMFLNSMREDELQTAERDLKRYTLTIAEQADRSIKSLDLVQTSVIDYIQRNRQSGGNAALDTFGTLEMNGMLKEKLSGLPHIDAITLQSADGRIINFSRDWPVPTLNVAFRDYFQGLKNNPSLTTFVSSPAPSAITGAWALYIARRLNGPDGEFLGVVNGTIKLQYFEDLYARTSLGEGSATSLMRDDGMLLARSPREGIGKVFANEPRIMGAQRTGLVRELSPIDQKMRIKAAHGLSTTPMFIVATQTEESILSTWRNTAYLFSGLSIGFSALLFVAAGLVLRWWRQHEQTTRIGEEKALAEKARAEAEAGLARERERAADDANKIKSAFLATMSHEIRTPMNGVLGMADLLGRTALTGQQQRMLTTINQSATTLLTVINDILDFSRIEAGRMDLESRAFDLRECVETVVELFTGAAEKKGLELSLHYPASVPSHVVGDVGRLRQVLINVIGNAVKFSGHGEVIVRVASRGEHGGKTSVAFSISDTGPGIDASAQALLFKPFAQADSSISRRFGGTGLGLSIAKHLVGLMDGTMALKSAPGAGTTVTFDARFGVDRAMVDLSPLAWRHLDRQPVLVVATAGAHRDALCAYLMEVGAVPETASSSDEAVQVLSRAAADDRPVTLAIIGIDNLKLARRIKATPSIANVRLIEVTSLTREADMTLAKAAGISGCLRRPIRRGDLLQAVETCFATVAADATCCGAIAAKPALVEPLFPGIEVLVAEDNPVNQEVAQEYLRELGCSPQVVENGRLAVDAFEGGRFAAILMDCQMPEMDGLTATRAIREIERQQGRPRTLIIAVTANAFDSDRQRCIEAGMDDFVSKPFTAAQLARALSTHLLRSKIAAVASADRAPLLKVAS